jgi:hypothetical protein
MVLRTAYVQGSDLPDLGLTWLDTNGSVIDFSIGWTFELKIGEPGVVALVTKTSSIVGAATSPNVTIAWLTTGELNTLAPGDWRAQLKATRTADGKQRLMVFFLDVNPAIL